MSIIFSTIAFFALIAMVVAGIAGVVGKARNRETRANIVALVCLGISIVCFVGFGLTHTPAEKPAQAAQASNTESAAPEEAQTPTPSKTTTTEPPEATMEPTQPPTDMPEETAPVEPEPTPAPEPEETPDPIEQDKVEIEAAARSILADHVETTVDRVTVNENYGTDADDDYVLLVYATWSVKNSVDMTKKVLATYSEDFAARIGTDAPKVNDLAIFWTVPYYSETDTVAKYSYERNSRGMYETDHMILLK